MRCRIWNKTSPLHGLVVERPNTPDENSSTVVVVSMEDKPPHVKFHQQITCNKDAAVPVTCGKASPSPICICFQCRSYFSS